MHFYMKDLNFYSFTSLLTKLRGRRQPGMTRLGRPDHCLPDPLQKFVAPPRLLWRRDGDRHHGSRTLLLTTKENNGRMMHIAKKVGLHDLGEIVDSGKGEARRAFATSRIELAQE